jgi:hypothetical protein
VSYPQPPDWNNATQFSGWYLYQPSAGQNSVCSFDGWDMLVALQGQLRDRLATAQPTFDGTQVDGTSVPANDPSNPGAAVGWNPATLRALWAVTNQAGVASNLLSAIQSDAQTGIGTISPSTLQVGIWIADDYYHGTVAGTGQDTYSVQVSQPSVVQIPQGTSYPDMDTAPPVPAGAASVSAGSTCNAIPPNAAALIPVVQTVVPFQFNELLVIGIALLAIGTLVVMSSDVPVVSKQIREEQSKSIAQAKKSVLANPLRSLRSFRNRVAA